MAQPLATGCFSAGATKNHNSEKKVLEAFFMTAIKSSRESEGGCLEEAYLGFDAMDLNRLLLTGQRNE